MRHCDAAYFYWTSSSSQCFLSIHVKVMLAQQLSIIPRTFLRYVTEMMHRSSHPAISLQRRAMGYGTMGLPAGDSIWSGASVPRSLALVFLTRLFRSRLWIMLLRHLQRRQLMAPPSFYRRRRLGSLPIQPPRPSTLNFNRCDMGTYAGEAYNSISSLKPGKEKNVISSYYCFCNCILNSPSQIIRKYTSFCFWVILCMIVLI